MIWHSCSVFNGPTIDVYNFNCDVASIFGTPKIRATILLFSHLEFKSQLELQVTLRATARAANSLAKRTPSERSRAGFGTWNMEGRLMSTSRVMTGQPLR